MSAQVRANWKVVVDAFQEAFHVSFVHRNTVCDAFTSKTNPYSHIAWVQLERMHRSASVYGVPELAREIHPAESLAFVYGTAFTQGAHAEAANLPGVNPAGIEDWAFDINVVFPTFFLDPSNHFYFTIQYWPSSVNQTRLDFRFYMPRAQNAGQLISQAYTNSIMRDAGLEDLGTIEDTQRMLESGALEHMILGDQEIALLHNYAVVDRMVRGEL
jgi:phenylpropionate dioxygenase-like ring-hydroxylating dioxygenase large terminal subunit